MKHTIEDTEQYLRETLHAPVRLKRWSEEATLPNYLRRYLFFTGTIGNTQILFMLADEGLTLRAARKHQQALQGQWAGPIAFIFDSITPRDRHRLVQEGISFVVPRKQIYLPVLGMDLTERFRRRMPSADRLRPSAQLLFLHTLTAPEPVADTPSAAADQLGYTAMAMGQALDQLEDAGLMRVRKEGRKRLFKLAGDRAELWERAQPMLANPVRAKRYVSGQIANRAKMPEAGLSALARYSMIAEPRIPVVAASREQVRNFQDLQDTSAMHVTDEADLEIEIWSYAPGFLAHGPVVDRLSLHLSLRDDPDERVQSALEEMMRDIPW